MNDKPSGTPGWVKTAVGVILFLPLGIWLGFQAEWRRSEPPLRAWQQLSRDLNRVYSLPKHQRYSEFLEAMVRANQACPDLVEWLESHDSENQREWAGLLRFVREHPNLTDPELLERISTTLKYDPDFFRKLPPPPAK